MPDKIDLDLINFIYLKTNQLAYFKSFWEAGIKAKKSDFPKTMSISDWEEQFEIISEDLPKELEEIDLSEIH